MTRACTLAADLMIETKAGDTFVVRAAPLTQRPLALGAVRVCPHPTGVAHLGHEAVAVPASRLALSATTLAQADELTGGTAGPLSIRVAGLGSHARTTTVSRFAVAAAPTIDTDRLAHLLEGPTLRGADLDGRS